MVSYFEDNYPHLLYPVGEEGFRSAQLAAVQSVAAHFFSSSTPAIVVMPTGSGKTVVATALAFVLRAKRVLVITPSRLLREQIADKFTSLVDLDNIRALELLTPRPKVMNLRSRIRTSADWDALCEYDVVVATVFGISGLKTEIPDIPPDLFDLVIVDEGHHAPAATWARALSHLSSARQVLLTATPFRRDSKEIKGKIVFTYDVRRAYNDKIFGDLTFRPANPGKGESIDQTIAREAEAQFKEDRGKGLKHLVMVRVDGLERGRQLEEVYAKTSLRLKFVSGKTALSTVKKTVDDLKGDKLDGIICVNMFGEGFDLPRLKIAALHSPHKSLAVTLQFIGRFARTTDPEIAGATFIAYPIEQRDEIQELWTTSAIWPDIVHNVSSLRIERETFAQQVFETFDTQAVPEVKDIPLGTITPFFHAKVFRCFGDVDLDRSPPSTYERQSLHSSYSEEHKVLVLIRRYVRKPKWISDSRIEDQIHHLDVIHYDKDRRFLFVGSTDKGSYNYGYLVNLVTDGKVGELSSAQVNRALNDIEGLTFFNLGMRPKQFGTRAESYRIMAGPGADIAVSELDGQSYNRGHSFGKGRLNGEEVTIGISTASKIWSNTVDQIPAYVSWCAELAKKLVSSRATPTGSGIDRLSAGQPIDEFPSCPVYAYYHENTYDHVPYCFEPGSEGSTGLGSLPDFDLQIIEAESSSVHFRVTNGSRSWDGVFRLATYPAVVPFDASEVQLGVGRQEENIPISEYLSNEAPRLLLENFDSVADASLFENSMAGTTLDRDDLEVVDWASEKVNVEMEKPPQAEAAARSVFDWLQERLTSSAATVIFNDDGAGEVADFIALTSEDGRNVVRLFHCKASSAQTAGSRLDDLYEVCGQSIRSGIWLSGARLVDRLEYRLRHTAVKGLITGTLEDLRRAFSASQRQNLRFEVVIVQPGVSASKLREMPEQLLITTKHSALAAGFVRFSVIGSA